MTGLASRKSWSLMPNRWDQERSLFAWAPWLPCLLICTYYICLSGEILRPHPLILCPSADQVPPLGLPVNPRLGPGYLPALRRAEAPASHSLLEFSPIEGAQSRSRSQLPLFRSDAIEAKKKAAGQLKQNLSQAPARWTTLRVDEAKSPETKKDRRREGDVPN